MVERGLRMQPYMLTELTNVSHQMLRAAFEIPLCVSYLYLVVQSLRVQLIDVREQYLQSPQA